MNRIFWCITLAMVAIAAYLVNTINSDSEILVIKTDEQQSIANAFNSVPADANAGSDFHFSEDDKLPAVNEDQINGEVIERWIADMSNRDGDTRAAATAKLLKLPKEKVLPLLQVLIASGNEDSRELAIGALKKMALMKGDSDGAIDNILRLVSYDGDGVLAGDAQLALEEIEQNKGRMILLNP